MTLEGTRWIDPAFVGHHVRITAPDGSVRGSYEIAAIENDEALQLLNGFYGVATQDAVPYEGYIVYSPSGSGLPALSLPFHTNSWAPAVSSPVVA